MSQFPSVTLVEKAGVDAGFDRRPVWAGDAVLLRSTHHDQAVIVAARGQAAPLQLWVPRARFSLTLTDVAGVELAERQALPAPIERARPEVALEVADIAALRRLLAACHRLFTQPESAAPAADAPASAGDAWSSTDAALHALPASTEITREVVARIGQERFRDALIDYWGGRCAVTGLSIVPLLRASHIKPWAACSTSRERLDVFNGLLLAPHLDATFDGGWIGFSDEGRVVVSPALDLANASRLGVEPAATLTRLDPRHLPYLRYHRSGVFRR